MYGTLKKKRGICDVFLFRILFFFLLYLMFPSRVIVKESTICIALKRKWVFTFLYIYLYTYWFYREAAINSFWRRQHNSALINREKSVRGSQHHHHTHTQYTHIHRDSQRTTVGSTDWVNDTSTINPSQSLLSSIKIELLPCFGTDVL